MQMYSLYSQYSLGETRPRPRPRPKNRWPVSVARSCVRCGKEFCLFTTIHGFNHIAVPGRHWTERVLWVCLTVGAIWGAIGVSLGQWQRYNENPTVVTLEKDFRTWMFNMPAITVCSKDRVDPKKLEKTITKYWGVNQLDAKYEYYSQFVSTVANSDLFHLQEYETYKDDESLNVDLYQLTVDVMPEFLVKPSWVHGLDIKWTPTMTELGACYVTNSVAIADTAIVKPDVNDTKLFPLTCKYSSLRCYVLLEIVNDTLVYSTNSCRLSCRSKLALKLCKCRPFYYFYEEGPACTPSGMWCLATVSHRLVNNDGIKCSCTAPCLDAVYKDISTSEQFWTSGQFVDRGSVKYTVQPPRSRYTREIVFHFQDLIVSFGGAAGLFLGASFISFVEILYFVFEKVIVLITKRNLVKEQKVQEKRAVVQSCEKKRILELNKILEQGKRYEPFKMY
ncbi:uncharacterized protein LOC116413459 isoform X2 [Galleria mellonella]|uniref:Uncharacterized protein LOC116413459 isoform X2 n=1 Tax=Galleria mellonella TaxID=7137 RepID=A0ABM3MUJ3_GALME|nr:uncharacterized protein LOC116413459 isoform X2 [Galleria mellonella]